MHIYTPSIERPDAKRKTNQHQPTKLQGGNSMASSQQVSISAPVSTNDLIVIIKESHWVSKIIRLQMLEV